MSADGPAEKKGSATGFITAEDKDRGTANEQKSTPGDALAGSPGDNDDSTLQYNAERHSCNDRTVSGDEQIPSSGWREVYWSMGVSVDAGR